MARQMKTVKQYSLPLPQNKLDVLYAIAKDYNAIKKYVYTLLRHL